MANVIGRTQGFNKTGSPKAGEATRLGQGYVRSEANTWRTFVSTITNADGSADIVIRRDEKIIATISINRESDAPTVDVCSEQCVLTVNGAPLDDSSYFAG